ncbi:MAG: heavy metal-associated domain-containing protein [Agriterribacter sp.]
MKNILLIIAFAFVIVSAKSQVIKADLQAAGLTCSMCNKSINAALQSLIFVESVQSDINNNLFSIVFKPGIKPDFDLLKKKVTDAGFSVANLWIYANFSQQQITNDTHVIVNDINMHFLNVKDQVLSGEKKIQLIDKDFITAKAYKKFNNATEMECFKTGYMAACCSLKKDKNAAQRVYHVTI